MKRNNYLFLVLLFVTTLLGGCKDDDFGSVSERVDKTPLIVKTWRVKTAKVAGRDVTSSFSFDKFTIQFKSDGSYTAVTQGLPSPIKAGDGKWVFENVSNSYFDAKVTPLYINFNKASVDESVVTLTSVLLADKLSFKWLTKGKAPVEYSYEFVAQ